MKKYDLLRSGDAIIRVLEVQGDRVLVIDCIKRRMPVWVDAAELESYSECTIGELSQVTGVTPSDVDALDADQRKVMYERYTMIVPALSFVANDWMRSRLICSVAREHGVSKQTVRNYLCLYLSYMDEAALAPRRREGGRALTQDEKNMRWALNKFFYTTKKQSLMTAYTMMLKEKYCDALGVLAEEYPSFYQFRYFYRKTRNLQNFYISRDGLKNYQRNNRPLTGEGVQEFAPAVGTGMLDATVCDIYLVNDTGSLVGRPILTACVDAYSGLCCGYSLSWEGGVYSLRGLMLNIIADNQNFKAIMQQEYSGIMGGSDSFTIIGASGIGKSSAISRAITLVTENRIIEVDSPYTKIIPCICVQCPFDSSVKGLLLEIFRKVDEVIGGNYYPNALRARTTTDMLIGSVSQVALNHIGPALRI